LPLNKLKARRSLESETTIKSQRRKRKLPKVVRRKLHSPRLLQKHQLLMAKRNKEKEITENKRKVRPMTVRQRGLSSQNIELKVKREKIKSLRKEKLQLQAKEKREIENQRIKRKMNKKMVNRPKMDQVSQSIESKEKRPKRKERK
jgi:hypothetical protein